MRELASSPTSLNGQGRSRARLGGSLGAIAPASEADFIERWEARAADFARYGAYVNGSTLVREVLTDLAAVRGAQENRVLSLSEAATWSGYSAAHLSRLVKMGRLRTLRSPGSRGRLTFQAADLPRKAKPPHTSGAGVHELASRLGIRGRGGPHGIF